MKQFFSNKYVKGILYALGALVLILIGYMAGVAGAKTVIEDEAVTLIDVQEKIDDKEKELAQVEKETRDAYAEKEKIVKEAETASQKIEEANKLAERKDALQSEIESLVAERDAAEVDLQEIQRSIETAEAELNDTQEAVTEAQAPPTQLPAGQFIVGTDLPEGRYKATAVGNAGNFVTYGAMGDLKVNTILDPTGAWGETEYIFNAEEGDQIELSAAANFQPVE